VLAGKLTITNISYTLTTSNIGKFRVDY
jgi:hypothetical protein